MAEARRVLVALGGNAMTSSDGNARPEDQRAAVEVAMEPVAVLLERGIEVVLTHGNGPQVGNLLVKNELAADVVPPVGLDWCGAQTQGSIGYIMVSALEAALWRRGLDGHATAMVTRVRVDPDDPAFGAPDKPVGRYVSEAEASKLREHGQHFVDFGAKGWRRVVPSPRPREVLDAESVRILLAAGVTPVAAGGGGIPVTVGPDARVNGVQAVLDKDRTAALLARTVKADTLVIATDVPAAVVNFGTPDARELHEVTTTELRRHVDDGQFAAGSMGPKVEAALDFVEGGGTRAVITALERLPEGIAGQAGTVLTREP
ncbi:carbamate kinase [Spiractinospora alimapuensis]|uniref:carbamate kinase n=1 Tax=Spiractinospora alimapuensis TaxID=2820884 RepID=UPI001F24732D|nr:carbamate kinase [Spiractinospora alimapuensis]QVQ53678.1 carbamate kinase [Spiractinospora alimapuensis]